MVGNSSDGSGLFSDDNGGSSRSNCGCCIWCFKKESSCDRVDFK